MKKVLSLLLGAALIAVLLAGCGTQGASSKENTSGGVFRVGMEAAYAPFNWTQNDNSNGGVRIEGTSEYAGGYDVEIAKKIAEGPGKELVIVKTEWGGLLPSLTSGTIDAIVAGMSPTAERKEAIDFSDNYYKSDLVMVVKRGGNYEQASSIQDFKNARVTGQLNTSHYKVIDQIDGVIKEAAMDDFLAMRVALESGIIDGYVSERPEGISASAANNSFVMLEFTNGFEVSDEDAAVAVGLKKGSDLTGKINEILAGISESQRQEIMDAAIGNQPSEQ